jgi:hypothetical protein
MRVVQSKSAKTQESPKWKIKSIDPEAFSSALVDSGLLRNLSMLNCSESCDLYNATLGQLLDEFAPQRDTVITIRPSSPWFNYDVRARREMRQAKRRWRSTRLTVHHDIMKEKRNQLTRATRRAKIKYYSDKINESASPKEIFQVISFLLQSKREVVLPKATTM